MNFTALCTFDLTNASEEDYTKVYEALEEIGLSRKVHGTNGEVNLPNTTVLGKFNGQTKAGVRDLVSEKIKNSFKDLNLKSKAFTMVSPSGNTWSQITT